LVAGGRGVRRRQPGIPLLENGPAGEAAQPPPIARNPDGIAEPFMASPTTEEPPALEPPKAPESSYVDSGRAVLTKLWEALSPEVEAQLISEGVDLDAPVDVPPWSDVEERFRREIGDSSEQECLDARWSILSWPDELNVESLSRRFSIIKSKSISIGDLQLAEVVSLVEQDNLDLADVATLYCDGPRNAKQSVWNRGGYEKSPVSTIPIPPVPRRAFYSTACAHGGWAAKPELFYDEFPELAELLAKSQQLQKQRDRKVEAYLRSLR
jgi:hypothetical protein